MRIREYLFWSTLGILTGLIIIGSFWLNVKFIKWAVTLPW